VALQRHEIWDGTGDPNGLTGEEIHIFARITELADVFDSLSHSRIYKDKWQMDQVSPGFWLLIFRNPLGRDHFKI
jgi:putative two-component system response regulator